MTRLGFTGEVLDLLDRRAKRQLFLLLPLIVLAGLMEVVGIASITPFLALVANDSEVERSRALYWLYTELGFGSTRGFLVFLGIGAALVIGLSNGVAAWTYWKQIHFVQRLRQSLAERLLRQYLAQPYQFFLNENSASISKNVLAETIILANSVLTAGMQVIAKATSAVLVVALLVIVDPVIALSAALVFGGSYAIIYRLARSHLSHLSREQLEANRQQYHAVSESIGGIKELKLLGREGTFLLAFSHASHRFAFSLTRGRVIAELPRYLLEFVAFGGIVLMVVFLLTTRDDLAAVLPIVGLYAFAAYRLMPALQSIFSGLANIRSQSASLSLIREELSRTKEARLVTRNPDTRMPLEDRLDLRDIRFRYAAAPAPLLDGFNLTIRARTSVAFVGSTGSGKTTVVDVILGLLTPEGGTIEIDGVPLTRDRLDMWQQNIGYVPQSIYLSDTSILENIAFGVPANEIDEAACMRAAKLADIHDFITTLHAGYRTAVGERGVRLSGGQRQRIGIARALYHDPEVLVFDEATSALDGATEENIFDSITHLSGQKTVILVAHRLTTIRACDVVYLLEDGRIEDSGTYEDLMQRSPRFRSMARVSPVRDEVHHG